MATLLQTWEALSPAALVKAGGRSYGVGDFTGRHYTAFTNMQDRSSSHNSGNVMFAETQKTSWESFNHESRENTTGIMLESLGQGAADSAAI